MELEGEVAVGSKRACSVSVTSDLSTLPGVVHYRPSHGRGGSEIEVDLVGWIWNGNDKEISGL